MQQWTGSAAPASEAAPPPDFHFDASRVMLVAELPVVDDESASDDSTWESEGSCQSQHVVEYEEFDPETFSQQWVDWPADLADALGSMDTGSETSHFTLCEAAQACRAIDDFGHCSVQANIIDELTYFADTEMVA
jgi:hypothetical protein